MFVFFMCRAILSRLDRVVKFCEFAPIVRYNPLVLIMHEGFYNNVTRVVDDRHRFRLLRESFAERLVRPTR